VGKNVPTRQPSCWFAKEGNSTNEAGRVGILAGRARAMPAERCRGRDYTNSHKMKGIGMGNYQAIQNQQPAPKVWPKVAIIILNWNGWRDTRECLKSLQRITYPNYRVIVVDNGSTDGSGDRLRVEFGQHTFIMTNENLGFAGGNNMGIKYALSEGFSYILILNNDTQVLDGRFLHEMVKYAEDNLEVGIIGPTVYKAEKKIQHTMLYFPTLFNTMCRRYLKVGKNAYDKLQQVEAVSGCCFLVRSKAIEEVGLLDENFFLYGEEIEWCYRMRKAGWQIIYLPVKSILHYGAQTTRREPQKMYILKRSNLVYMLAKHGFAVHGAVLGSLIVINHLRKIAFTFLKIVSYEQIPNWALLKELAKDILKKWRLGRSEAS